MTDAAVPGLLSVVERIDNADIRYSVTFLADELSRNRVEIDAIRSGHDSMMAKLDFISSKVSGIPNDDGARVLWPVPPAMIVACSPHSSPLSDNSSVNGISHSSQSLSNSRSSSASRGNRGKRRRPEDLGPDCIWLKCPFCCKQHWNEKSHVQHVDRASERYVPNH
jgi:hypothetical protein